MKKTLLFELIFVTFLVAFLYIIGLEFLLYWVTDWYDIVMHFLGGLWIALFATYLFFVLRVVEIPTHNRVVIVLVTLGSVLIVGLGWELWELFSGLTFVFKDLGDTILDLIMDMIGGTAGLAYSIRILCKKN